ncbi:hypothetical protein [Mesorhizobium sp. KR9-304]|uniref:hypothetical protein n=1 Tax=Mesorhizobium sp. KR9-304 TaxID=3156614 RepID=UPI0032B5B608
MSTPLDTKNAAAHIGKSTSVAAPTAIESVTVFGSNDHGYCSNTNPSITITLYGKTGSAPASRTDGTTLGSTTFTDTANESTGRQINSSDTATYWDHVWVGMSIVAN